MGPLLVVAFDPEIKIVLQLLDRRIELFSEGDAELVEDCLVEALSDAVRLRALRLGPGMINVLDRKRALGALAPHLPPEQKREAFGKALAPAKAIDDDYRRSEALAALAIHLPQEAGKKELLTLNPQDHRVQI